MDIFRGASPCPLIGLLFTCRVGGFSRVMTTDFPVQGPRCFPGGGAHRAVRSAASTVAGGSGSCGAWMESSPWPGLLRSSWGGGRVTRTAEQRGPIRCRRLSWACCARGVQTTRRTPAGPSCFPFPRAPPFTTGGAWGCMTNEIFVSGRGLWKVGLASRLCLSLPQFWFISAVH